MSGSNTWRDELASLVEDTGIRYSGEPIGVSTASVVSESRTNSTESESLKDQVKGFAMAWGEILMELGRGCRDIVQQSLLNQDSYIVRKLQKPYAKVSGRLKYLNEFLPEDRDPAHAWSVIFFVFILALAAMSLNTQDDSMVPQVKMVSLHPPSANRILLPDGRHMAYCEQGVSADRARFSIIAPHSFLSSRLAGIPGVKMSLLGEFGVRLVSYDLPGFGESDPHPDRNLNSSAFDMLYLANAVGISDKFWVLGHSSGSMHAWAALKYIPDRIAGAAMLAPTINPYERGMTKEEMKRTWEKWLPRRKLLYFLARRFPKFLSYFYRRSFLSGKHDRIDNRLFLSLGKRDEFLIEEPIFEEFWHRDVEESIRQGNTKPFIEEAVLQVSDWGFSLADLQVQKKCQSKGVLSWLKSFYSEADCELAGFLGPIHIWQGMDDHVVPPSMTDYIVRVLPAAIVHMLQNDGHFSYFFFCDDCHRRIFSTLFGISKGPLDRKVEIDQTPLNGDTEAVSTVAGSTTE
uniref:AB hydrolase-1 domain-containing protein n=1 Tax=Fagus sylvatica TaxID=28930 RepID=A0A2N9IL84_FAGSY